MQSDTTKKEPGATAGQERDPPEISRTEESVSAPAPRTSAPFPPAAAACEMADLRRRLAAAGVDLQCDGDAYLVVAAAGITVRLLSLAAVEAWIARRLGAEA